MRKLFVLIIVVLAVSYVSSAFALNIADDFSSYGSGDIFDNAGSSGADPWTQAWERANIPAGGNPSFVGSSGWGEWNNLSSSLTPQPHAQREFNTISGLSGNGIKYDVKLTKGVGNLQDQGSYATFTVLFQDETGTEGGVAFYSCFAVIGGSLGLYASKGANDAQNLLVSGGTPFFATAGDTYSIKISSFDSSNYTIQVAGYDSFTLNTKNSVNSLHYVEVLGYTSNTDLGNPVYGNIDNLEINGVPEPSSVAFFGMGLLGLIGAGWRSFKKS